jgi:hypothetical protein
LIGVARKSASIAGARCSARQKHKTRQTITRQWMADGVHDAMTMRSRVEMAFVVARPWRLGLGSSGAGALAMWQCGWPFHVSTDFDQLHRSLFPANILQCAWTFSFHESHHMRLQACRCSSLPARDLVDRSGNVFRTRLLDETGYCRHARLAISYGAYIHIPRLT